MYICLTIFCLTLFTMNRYEEKSGKELTMMQVLGRFADIRWRWIVFFAGILAAWSLLFAMEVDIAAIREYGDIDQSFWAALCAAAAEDVSFIALFAMWGLMSAAMMAPTAIPAFRTFDDLTHTAAADGVGFIALIGGYLVAWLGFSAFAAAAQMMMTEFNTLDPTGQSISTGLNVSLLAIAGLYQFSQFKEACLSKCRAPMMFFLAEWRDGPKGAFTMGLNLGAICIGCCWALMLIGFIGGIMNLLWMGVAMVLMATEKLPVLGQHVTRPLGVILLVAASWTAATALIFT